MRRIMVCVVAVALFACFKTAAAQSNISSIHKNAWGENIGWTNWRDANGTVDGVIIHDTFLSGYIWCENVGWLNVGDGNGPYGNNDDTDFGVNIEPGGDLNGYAWGENIGWVNFDTGSAEPDQARFDFDAWRFRGYAWGENVGWINLDDATHFVGTTMWDPIPTVSQWGMIAMTLLVMVAGTILFRRVHPAMAT